jgi:hypothetical protein
MNKPMTAIGSSLTLVGAGQVLLTVAYRADRTAHPTFVALSLRARLPVDMMKS